MKFVDELELYRIVKTNNVPSYVQSQQLEQIPEQIEKVTSLDDIIEETAVT